VSVIYTTASRILAEVRRLEPFYAGASKTIGHIIGPAFSCDNKVPWEVGVRRFRQLIQLATNDIDVVTEARRQKYRQTLEVSVGRLALPQNYGANAQAYYNQQIDDLTLERLESLHENLLLARRYISIEEASSQTALGAVHDLIDELSGLEESEVTKVVLEQLRHLQAVLENYNLFGPEGAKDAVSMLIGATLNEIYTAAIFPGDTKNILKKALGVAKIVSDVFVYVTDVGQALEWSGENLTKLLE
jgi:hypothetical protein